MSADGLDAPVERAQRAFREDVVDDPIVSFGRGNTTIVCRSSAARLEPEGISLSGEEWLVADDRATVDVRRVR